MKKILIMLIVTMLILFLIACSKPEKNTTKSNGNMTATENVNKEGFPIVNEEITLTLMGIHNSYLIEDWTKSDFFTSMNKMTNINFEIETILNTAYKEKFNLLFVSDNLPDVFYKVNMTHNDISSYASQGYFIDLAPMMDEYAPNLTKLMEENPLIRQEITLPDGTIPTLPQIGNKIPKNGIWINQTWLDTLGLEIPTNADEFYTVLKAFKEQDPNGNGIADEIPMSIGASDGPTTHIQILASAFGGFFGENGCLVDPDTGIVEFVAATESYKRTLAFLSKLYAEDLVDNEMFTQKSQQIKAKGTAEEVLLGSIITSSPLLEVGAERHYEYSIIPVLENDIRTGYPEIGYVTAGKFAILDTNEDPKASLRWVDYLYSEEGGKTTWMGIEDENYTMNDDGTWDWLICEGEDTNSHRAHASMQPGGNFAGIIPALWNKTTSPQELHLIKEREKTNKYLVRPFPPVYIGKEDSKNAIAIYTDIDAYVREETAKFITGALTVESNWDEYVSTLEGLKVAELVEIMQRAYDSVPK